MVQYPSSTVSQVTSQNPNASILASQLSAASQTHDNNSLESLIFRHHHNTATVNNNNSSGGVSDGALSPNNTNSNTVSTVNSVEEERNIASLSYDSAQHSAMSGGDGNNDAFLTDIFSRQQQIESIDNEAHLLSCDYINCKLRKCGLNWATCPALPEPSPLRLAMRTLGEEYERRYKQYFDGMCVDLPLSPATAYPTFFGVADELFTGGGGGCESTSWSYIVALYSFGGALSAYCIRKQMPQMVPYVADWVALYTESRLSPWIAANGGWNGLLKYYEKRPQLENSNKHCWQSLKGVITGVGAFCGVLTVVVTVGAMLASKS